MGNHQYKALALIALYLVPRFLFSQWWMQLPIAINYSLEFFYSISVLFIYRSEFKIERGRPRRFGLLILFFMSAGAMLRYWAPNPIPFRLQSAEIFLQLLVIAPLLEEFIFRWSQWILWEKLIRHKYFIIFITSLIFSGAHLLSLNGIPNEYRNFIFYQGAYTFVLAIGLGMIRSKNFFLSCVAIHFFFNLGFALSSMFIEKQNPPQRGSLKIPKILVFDMPIDFKLFNSRIKANFLRGDSTPVNDEYLENCQKRVESLEKYLSNPKVDLNQNETEIIQNTLEELHGYHILGLILNYAPADVELFFAAAKKHPSAQMLPSHNEYIREYIHQELNTLETKIIKWKPDIIQIASSDSWDENFSDYQKKGLSNEKASIAATEIMNAWRKAWSDLIAKHPQALFVVSAGNGGLDGIGDSLSAAQDKEVLPASLKFNNLIRVASYGIGSEEWSAFSNYSNSLIDLTAPGEDILSNTGCPPAPQIALDGTSQASALASAFFAHVVSQNRDPKLSLLDLPQEVRWKDKVIEGRFLPAQ